MIRFHAFDIKEERTAFPTPKQFRVGANPSYLNSLVAGCFSPILHLPQILWFNSLWPFIKSLVMGVAFIGVSMIAGLLGRANGFVITQAEPRKMTEEEKQQAINEMLSGSGYRAVPLNAPEQDFSATGQH